MNEYFLNDSLSCVWFVCNLFVLYISQDYIWIDLCCSVSDIMAIRKSVLFVFFSRKNCVFCCCKFETIWNRLCVDVKIFMYNIYVYFFVEGIACVFMWKNVQNIQRSALDDSTKKHDKYYIIHYYYYSVMSKRKIGFFFFCFVSPILLVWCACVVCPVQRSTQLNPPIIGTNKIFLWFLLIVQKVEMSTSVHYIVLLFVCFCFHICSFAHNVL